YPWQPSAPWQPSPSLQILNLFAKLVDHRLQLQPDRGHRGGVRLGAQGIRFAIEFLRQKIELAADGAAAAEQHARGSDMRLQPVDLLVDVGLGGEEGRFLMQPDRVEI